MAIPATVQRQGEPSSRSSCQPIRHGCGSIQEDPLDRELVELRMPDGLPPGRRCGGQSWAMPGFSFVHHSTMPRGAAALGEGLRYRNQSRWLVSIFHPFQTIAYIQRTIYARFKFSMCESEHGRFEK